MKSNKKLLSVTIITMNEAEMLPGCLESVASIADEIIIVDSGSTDGTEEIAKQHGARFIVNAKWPGFGPQKNLALSYALYPWILSLDADERLDETLKQEISKAIEKQICLAYACRREEYVFGKKLKYSSGKRYGIRLFQSKYGQFQDRLVHETVLIKGCPIKIAKPYKLNGYILHYTYRSQNELARKQIQYSESGALQMYKTHTSSFIGQDLFRGFWTFLRLVIFKLAILDGALGLKISWHFTMVSYLKYKKLHQLNKNLNLAIKSNSH